MTRPDPSPRLTLKAWDRLLLIGSFGALVALAWGYLFRMGRDGSMMTMSADWNARYIVMMFIMWAVMMVGMMVPTAVRALMIYARIASQARERARPVASVWWFASGYIIAWTGFSVAATALQRGLDSLGVLSPMMTLSHGHLAAALLIFAGVYQLTPWKDVCLRHCQTPAAYLAGRFGPGMRHGVGAGLAHGMYCLGCCWVLMLLLFVGGVMNLIWIAVITGFVLLEKLLPPRAYLSKLGGIGLIGTGVWMLI